MYVPTVFAEIPLTGGIVKGRRKSGDYTIKNPLSSLTLKILLLSWSEQRITSTLITNLTKSPTRFVFSKIEQELSSVMLNDEHLFNVSEIKPFGKERRIDYSVQAQLRELFETNKFIQIKKEELKSCSSETPIDILVLLLSKRPQRKNYAEFLVNYLLGIPLQNLDKLEQDAKAFRLVQRINRARERVLKACKLLNLNISYELTRIPVGRYTARWFKILEFK